MYPKLYLILFVSTIYLSIGTAQIDTVTFTETASLEFPPPGPFQLKSSLSSLFDRNERPFLYSANMEFGLGIYDISETGTIEPIIDLDISTFEGLDVSNIKQEGNLLFLALGDFQATNPSSGLAIVDVTTPEAPIIRDIWASVDFVNGVSHLLINDDHAYLSMMNDGLLILDISNPDTILYESDMIPDLSYPAPSEGHHQGRGLDFRNDTIFYCFDRGGLRLIDVSNKSMPIEVESYINTTLNDNAGAAYNDVFIVDDFAFVSVDYCGLEVLNIGNEDISRIDWYNPWGCNLFNWNGADLHMNELITSNNDSLLYISAGNSELIVFDISDPYNIKKAGQFFDLDNSLAAYGVDVFNNQVSLSYVSNPINIPFVGNWGGLKLLDLSEIVSAKDVIHPHLISVFPNPTSETLGFSLQEAATTMEIFSLEGQLMKTISGIDLMSNSIDISELPSGSYFVRAYIDNKQFINKFVKI